MRAFVFAAMSAFVLCGCAISGTQILAYTAGAVTVAANAKEVAETIEEIKDIKNRAKAPTSVWRA